MKIGKFKLNNKRLFIIGGLALAIILIIAVVVFMFVGRGDSQEEKLTKRLEELGVSFYEEFYYKQVGTSDEKRAEFLKKYSSIGIKVDLNNLARYNGDSETVLKEFINNKTDKECDKNNSRVIIYPQEPYGKKSYKIEVELDCGFEEKK